MWRASAPSPSAPLPLRTTSCDTRLVCYSARQVEVLLHRSTPHRTSLTASDRLLLLLCITLNVFVQFCTHVCTKSNLSFYAHFLCISNAQKCAQNCTFNSHKHVHGSIGSTSYKRASRTFTNALSVLCSARLSQRQLPVQTHLARSPFACRGRRVRGAEIYFRYATRLGNFHLLPSCPPALLPVDKGPQEARPLQAPGEKT